MKGEYLLDALEYLDDDIIEKTRAIKSSKKKYMWVIWVIVVVLAITAGLFFYMWVNPEDIKLTNPVVDVDKNIPKLKLTFGVEGMHFEGLMFYDISERDDGNPWTEDAQLETLPVYKNLAYTDVSGMPVYLKESEMESLAEDVAAKLETKISEIETNIINFTHGSPDEEGTIYVITAKTPLGKIRVYGNGEVYVSLSENVELPSEYSFTKSDTSDEEAEKTILFLLEKYPLLANLERPIISTWGDYTFSGEQLRCYAAFDGKGNVTRQILNFNFNQISFNADDNGKLCGYRIQNILSAAEKLGDYPIITKQEAEKLYREGNFFTTVPADYMPTDKTAKCELVYRTGNGEKTFMPYYRFYVELMGFEAKNQAKGLKCYGTYYVPAVRSEYLG